MASRPIYRTSSLAQNPQFRTILYPRHLHASKKYPQILEDLNSYVLTAINEEFPGGELDDLSIQRQELLTIKQVAESQRLAIGHTLKYVEHVGRLLESLKKRRQTMNAVRRKNPLPNMNYAGGTAPGNR